MSRATVQWNGDAWLRDVFVPEANNAMRDVAVRGQAIVQASMKPGPPRPNQPPAVRDGSLRKSIHAAGPNQTGQFLVSRVYSDHIAARIQEFGGTIRPKKQKALCFPINRAAELFARKRGGARAYTDGQGVHMRGVLLALMFKYNGARGGKGMPRKHKGKGGGGYRFVFKSAGKGRGGIWGVVQRGAGKNARFIESEPMFAVKRQVTLFPHPFLRPLVWNPDNRAVLKATAQESLRARLLKRRAG